MRALGQKYMGIRPQKHSEEMFKVADGDMMTMDGGHGIPLNVGSSCLVFVYLHLLISSPTELSKCTM